MKIKKIIPDRLKFLIVPVVNFIRKINLINYIKYSKSTKFVYIAYIKIFPSKNWGYEKILDYFYSGHYLGQLERSILFLHYFNIYYALNPNCIIYWRVKASISYLMLHDINNLEKTMQSYLTTKNTLNRKNNLCFNKKSKKPMDRSFPCSIPST